MFAHQPGRKIARHIGDLAGRGRLSYEKRCDCLANDLIEARGLSALEAFAPDLRHVKRDRRARQFPMESGILTLT